MRDCLSERVSLEEGDCYTSICLGSISFPFLLEHAKVDVCKETYLGQIIFPCSLLHACILIR